jgi:uncharacterized RmlC-like cupin family protein
LQRKLVAPFQKYAARSWIGKRLERSIAESLLDLFYLDEVVGAGAVAQAKKFLGPLIARQDR